MAVILFKLRNVPEDEAQDIRDILEQHDIDYYETSAGIFGFSMPAIWLKDESQLETASCLIEDYQQQRLLHAHEEYARQQLDGKARTIFDIFKEAPLRYIGYILTIALVVYFTVILFIQLGN